MTITATRAVETRRADAPVPPDDTCLVCRKLRKPERSRKYAGHTADRDPFCSSTCARVFYQNPLPNAQPDLEDEVE